MPVIAVQSLGHAPRQLVEETNIYGIWSRLLMRFTDHVHAERSTKRRDSDNDARRIYLWSKKMNKYKDKKLFKRIIDKIKECLMEIAILVSAAAALVPFIIDKLKILIYSIKSLLP